VIQKSILVLPFVSLQELENKLNMDDICEEIIRCHRMLAQDFQYSDNSGYSNVITEVTKEIIRQHEFNQFENEHPAIKELRKKLEVVTILLSKGENE
jgi:hypothetical protein